MQELSKVKINQDDVKILCIELEISKSDAEHLLKQNQSDLKKVFALFLKSDDSDFSGRLYKSVSTSA